MSEAPLSLQEQSSHMDRLTQTQNSIDDLIKIMYSSLSYLTRKANFKQVSEDYPITQTIPNADSPETLDANRKELVGDFLRKAKQLEYLISVLPEDQDTENDQEIEELEAEIKKSNADYLAALDVAETLHNELQTALRSILIARGSSSLDPPA